MYTFNHCCHYVSNMERSMKFYEDNFGMEKLNEINNERFQMVFIGFKSAPDFFLELIKDKNKSGVYDLGDKSFHFAFFTDDFDECYSGHNKSNIVVSKELEKCKYFVEDPDGYLIEILKKR